MTTKLSDLREALERYDKAIHWSQHPMYPPIVAAARRFLALTETGPDYEAAWEAFMKYTARSGYDWPMVVREIADAALADYLEDTDA